MISKRAQLRNSVVLLLVVGGLAVVGGVYLATRSGEGRCGGRAMAEGDICHTTVNGIPTGDNTSGEQRTRSTVVGWLGVGMGVLMAGAGVRNWMALRALPKTSSPDFPIQDLGGWRR